VSIVQVCFDVHPFSSATETSHTSLSSGVICTHLLSCFGSFFSFSDTEVPFLTRHF
jgi:hypothetical protein